MYQQVLTKISMDLFDDHDVIAREDRRKSKQSARICISKTRNRKFSFRKIFEKWTFTLRFLYNEWQNVFNEAKLCKREFNEHVVPYGFIIPGRSMFDV